MLRPRVRRLFRLPPRRSEDILTELEDELRFHLENRTEELRAQGMSPEDAWNEAVRRFGTLERARRRLATTAQRREGRMRLSLLFDAFTQDTRYVVRQLARSPGFTAAVTATLALGVGANATMFGVLDRLLLRPPAHVVQPERLARLQVTHTTPRGTSSWVTTNFSYADFRNLRDATLGLPVAAYWTTNATLDRGSAAQAVRTQLVSPSFFDLVGPKPQAGRFFVPDDGIEPVGQPVAVIGHGLWMRRFGGARDVIGQQLRIGPTTFTVIGVAPRYFSGLGNVAIDVWIPLTSAAGIRFGDGANWMSARNTWLSIIARVPGDSQAIHAATTKVAGVLEPAISNGERSAPTAHPEFAPVLRRYAARNNPDVKVARLLMAVSVFVLLIACGNVANLLLARAIKRRQEVAVRLALGVSPARLATMMLAESAMLAVLGGLGAVAVVHIGGRMVRARLLSGVTAWSASLVDARVLAFTCVATFVVIVLIAAAPLMQSLRTSVTAALAAGGRTSSGRTAFTRSSLVVAQVTLCTVLLVGTGLFVRSLQNVNDLRLGMDTKQVLAAQMDLSSVGRAKHEIAATFLTLARRVRVMPGVRSASVAMALPLASSWADRLIIPGIPKLPSVPDGGPYFNLVDEHFFSTLGTRILRGRGITAADVATSANVAVVNESMAKLFWPNDDPIGRCIKVGGDTMPCATIVGIVENARRQRLLEGTSVQYFLPLSASVGSEASRVLLIRASGRPDALVERVQRDLQRAGADFPYVDVRPMQTLLDGDFKPWTLGSTMFGVFGGLALVLASIGLYAMLAYDVAQRTRELSVRMALGAQSRDIMRLVMRRGIGLAASGTVFGVLLALGGGRWIKDLLYDVSTTDAAVFAAVVATLLLTAFIATTLPARRATRVDLRTAMTAE